VEKQQVADVWSVGPWQPRPSPVIRRRTVRHGGNLVREKLRCRGFDSCGCGSLYASVWGPRTHSWQWPWQLSCCTTWRNWKNLLRAPPRAARPLQWEGRSLNTHYVRRQAQRPVPLNAGMTTSLAVAGGVLGWRGSSTGARSSRLSLGRQRARGANSR
jgi:hypothetical protein